MNEGTQLVIGIFMLSLIVISGIGGCMAVAPRYNVYSQEMKGRAELARADQNRQILVTQAQSEKEAATLRAQAIEIMGQAAQQYPEYRQQEFMAAFGEALREGKMSQIIYVPTEANVPLMEAGKR